MFLLFIVLFSFSTMNAQQPFSGCWHPDFIKDWTPEKDPDRKFNRSSVPLQTRMAADPIMKAHSEQFPDGQVAACLTMHPMCSQVPAQGADNFIGYNPTYWQYMDLLIWWGGSAGEGIILPPSAPVIDAAHLSGVKVLGQIFFPPTAFGGKPEWTTQMNTEEDGKYPYARKCAEIAKYYGFDGWFINSETSTGTNWGEWTKDYLKYAKEIGLEGQEIQLYVMSSNTSGAYIEDTAQQKGGSYFVNYGGANSTTTVINRMNSHVSNGWGDKADAFRTWYYGVEQAQGGITGNGGAFNNLFPKAGHNGSIDFFNPEEHIWKKVVENLLNTTNNNGSQAYTAMTTVFKNEGRFWTNNNDDVTVQRSGTSYMEGLATAIQERSAITSIPFITTFSAGLGKHRFLNGEIKGTQDWYHRGMQTVMPTWRWRQMKGYAATTDIKFAYNWDDAYNMGTSINLSGNLTNDDYSIYLYETDLAVASGDKLEFVYKTNKPGTVKIKLADSSNGLYLLEQTPTSTKTVNGWTIDTYDLTALAGKKLRTVGIGIKPGADGSGFTAQLGQLGIFPANYNPSAAQVTNLKIENSLTQEGGDLRVVWDKSTSEDVHHYNVYLERNGVTRLAGQTRNEGFYIPKFTRTDKNEKSMKVTVKAVNKDMKEATSGPSVTAEYPAISLPEVSMVASKTLVKPGEEVTFTATATNYPEEYTWSAPEGAQLVSSNANVATMKFNQEGLFDITVAVKNEVGTTTCTIEEYINVSATAELSIVSRASAGGSIHSWSSNMGTGSTAELPKYLIDDTTVPGSVNQKWCAGGDKEHWTIIELDKIYELYRFMIYDCGNKENASDNLTHYRIYTSMEDPANDNWTLALDMQNVPATAANNIKDDYVKPILGRYIKFVPYDPEKAITIRIWQFDAYGMSVAMKPVISGINASKSVIRTNEEVTFTAVVSENPTSYEWSVEGGTLVSQTANTAVFKFAETGEYDVTVKATNAVGSTSKTVEKLVLVSNTMKEVIMPLPVKTGFMMDAIAEAKPSADHSSAPLDDQGWVFYTSGAQEAGAIPMNTNGISTSNSGIPYHISPLNGNNTLLLHPTGTASLSFDGEYNASEIYFITTSMNGASALTATITYTDGTKSESKSFALQDWCGSGDNTAFGSIGRIIRATKDGYSADTAEPAKCRMFECVLSADPTKTIQSLDFTKTGNRPAIFAVSAKMMITSISLGSIEDVSMFETEVENIEVTYNLGVAKEDNFAVNVTSIDNSVVEIANINVDETNSKITFDVKGLKVGTTDVTVSLTNGDDDVNTSFSINVLVGAALNVIDNVAVKESETRNIEASYSMNMEKADNFAITATPVDGEIVEVKNLTVNEADGKYTFDIVANKIGKTDVKVKLVNGTLVKETQFEVEVVTSLPESLERPDNQTITGGETRKIETEFSFGDKVKQSNFAITVVSDDEATLSISELIVDEEKSLVSFVINALKSGEATVTISMTNGDNVINKSFVVTILRGEAIDNVAVKEVKVWPNPVLSGETLFVETANAQMIRISSLQGSLLKQQEATGALTEINTSGLTSGIYMLQVIDNEGMTISKIIIK